MPRMETCCPHSFLSVCPWEERLEVGDEGVAKVYRIIALPGGHSPKQRLSQCPARNLSSSSMGTKGGFRFLSWGDLL